MRNSIQISSLCTKQSLQKSTHPKLFPKLETQVKLWKHLLITLCKRLMLGKNIRLAFSEALKVRDYSIKALAHEHKTSALKFVQKQFFQSEPSELAFYKQFPEQKPKSYLYWQRVNRLFGEELFHRGLSFGCFDHENGGMIGAILSKDYAFTPLKEPYPEEGTFLYAVRRLREKMLAEVVPQYYSLVNEVDGEEARMIEMWFAAVHPQQRNKGLLRKMMTKLEQVGARKSYQYIFSWATNVGTAVCYKRLGYQNISEVDVSEFEVNGVRYFRDVEQQQRYQSFWIKSLPKFADMDLQDP